MKFIKIIAFVALSLINTPVLAGEVHGSHGDPIGQIIKEHEAEKKFQQELKKAAPLATVVAHQVKIAMLEK